MELIEAAGGFSQQPEKLISGGPMMGFAMVSAEAPVTKTSSSILAFQGRYSFKKRGDGMYQLCKMR